MAATANLVHIVTLRCKDSERAKQCLQALAQYGRKDALEYQCQSYEFGLKEGTHDTIYLIERWQHWRDLDRLLTEKVVPALPLYNELLLHPFNPAKDTLRIRLSSGEV